MINDGHLFKPLIDAYAYLYDFENMGNAQKHCFTFLNILTLEVDIIFLINL